MTYQYRVRRDKNAPWSRWVTIDRKHHDALRESETTEKRKIQ